MLGEVIRERTCTELWWHQEWRLISRWWWRLNVWWSLIAGVNKKYWHLLMRLQSESEKKNWEERSSELACSWKEVTGRAGGRWWGGRERMILFHEATTPPLPLFLCILCQAVAPFLPGSLRPSTFAIITFWVLTAARCSCPWVHDARQSIDCHLGEADIHRWGPCELPQADGPGWGWGWVKLHNELGLRLGPAKARRTAGGAPLRSVLAGSSRIITHLTYSFISLPDEQLSLLFYFIVFYKGSFSGGFFYTFAAGCCWGGCSTCLAMPCPHSVWVVPPRVISWESAVPSVHAHVVSTTNSWIG